MHRPAPTSSAIDKATCVATSARRRRWRPNICAPVPASRSVVARCAGAASVAGASAKRTTVLTAIAAANHRTRASTGTFSWIGSSDGGANPMSRPVVHCRAISAPAVPRPASTTPSTSNCWTIRQRPAPIDSRMAISRCRAVARARRSPARLAHAISSTTMATAIKISRTGRSTLTPPVGDWSSGKTAARCSM